MTVLLAALVSCATFLVPANVTSVNFISTLVPISHLLLCSPWSLPVG